MSASGIQREVVRTVLQDTGEDRAMILPTGASIHRPLDPELVDAALRQIALELRAQPTYSRAEACRLAAASQASFLAHFAVEQSTEL